jgi:ligand-binding SRPBCC domain-containing protein
VFICGFFALMPPSRERREPLGFEIATDLAAPPDVVWAHASSLAGIQDELRPLLRMTFPASAARLTTETVTLGRRLFRSWVLLFGFIPVEYDDLTIVALEPGHRFLERSATLTQRVWQHERIVVARAGSCTVTDRLRLEPRLPVLRGLQVGAVRLLFRHRHRRLGVLFG